ncbi:F-box only protein 50 [Brienomyrus brachyistius]|uniref:F-box only protein 50 n=1 Tax=Brienomyrus brachyistius TaxID=42636 RepID=UPI0020B18BF1|nr:F-box only protein 50 [Brienomyrus brachyistius]
MAANDWKQKCGSELKLEENNLPMPDTVDWKFVYEKKPLGRNLLKNPSPFGLDQNTPPPPKKELAGMFGAEPPRSEPEGDFSDWTTSEETLPYDTSGIPAGVAICYLPRFSWFTLEQKVDLKEEGFWDELLDDFQPDIAIEDWYEESQLHKSVYVLKVTLLGADGQTVIKEHMLSPEEDQRNDSHTWKRVTHVFSGYGPGVRQIHFLHKLKNRDQIHVTHATGSSVIVRATRSTRP